jgi:insertion element IS1 protein InsB
MLTCPNCTSGKIIKFGKTKYGKQKHSCKDCGRQFVAGSTHLIDELRRGQIRRLLQERISLRGISRAMQVSMTWLMGFAESVWNETPDDLGANTSNLDKLADNQLTNIELQVDEMWSFVGEKKFKKWIWVIYCPFVNQALALHVGGRGKKDAKLLFSKLPSRLRDNCKFATDYWEAYYQTINQEQHKPGKEYTYWIEGYFAGVRARVSRLVRRSLSFSKKAENHIAAIGYFLWQRNLQNHHYI